jgi:hypothetical protein
MEMVKHTIENENDIFSTKTGMATIAWVLSTTTAAGTATPTEISSDCLEKKPEFLIEEYTRKYSPIAIHR